MVPEKLSLNAIYRGIHYRTRSAHKEDWYYAIMEAQPQRYRGEFPVRVHYHFKLPGTKLDVSNHAYMVKMAEDALVAARVIPDDSPKYVSGIEITAEKAKEAELVIHILSTGC